MTSAPGALSDLDTGPCIDGWRAKLLDFSARNRSLFFRPTRSTLSIKLPEPDLWNRLNADEAVDLPLDLFLQDAPADTEQSARVTDDLRRRIKSLQTTARTFVEEQGVHVLHMPVGWLTWPDELRPPGPGDVSVTMSATGRKARLVKSPLLFVPVTLQTTARGWRLKREEGVGIEANLTLLGYLQTLNILVQIDDEDEVDAAACLETFREAVSGREHFSVAFTESSTIDTFSFKKVAMLRELERSPDLIAAQPVLRALCGDSQTLLAASNPRDYDPLDEKVGPTDVALAVDADSSQLKAVLAVLDGASLVIQGPPGTGKSQTITNLISAAAARGKSVLFVAEKKAARDVVVDNLTASNLDDLVLHITEEVVAGRSATAKKDIAEQFRAILEQGPGKYGLIEATPQAFENTREALNAYDRHLHTRLSQLSISTPFQLLEGWATCDRALLPADAVVVPSVHEVDDAWLDAVGECASSLDDLGATSLDQVREPWLHMNMAADTDQRALKDALDCLAATPSQLQALADQAGFRCEAWTDANSAHLARILYAMETLERKGLLSFLSPKHWQARSTVSTFLREGGHVVANPSDLRASLSAIQDAWLAAFDLVKALHDIPSTPLESTSEVARTLLTALPSYAISRTALRVISTHSPNPAATALLLRLLETRRPGQAVSKVLGVVLWHAWADEAASSVAEFSTTAAAHSRLQQRFVDADRALKEYSLYSALNAFAPNRPSMQTIAPPESELGILRAQVSARRRKPLRWLFSKAAGAILRLKPVIVASPLAVAQFLSSRAYAFDLVVFDEASQIPTADAIIAMSRGKQIVVVGDSQQMPPTSFFDRVLSADSEDTDDFDFESVLQQCEALLPSKRLLWHYRSRDERLIAFSNQLFYGGSLRTFPSSWADHPDLGVKFVYLPGAIYGRGGNRANSEEAEKVIQLLTEELRKDPEADVGVTAMSQAQQAEIQARLESEADGKPELEAWLAKGRVKNLETIQGDECDVMILSFGYGKDAAGNLHLNFGPLSQDNGYRRLNVAATRARRKTVVVSSIRAADIPLATVGPGGKLVRQYLDYAERGPIALSGGLSVSGVDRFESPLEEDIASELRALGWPIDTQVGVSGYRIDLGVRDPALPGRYIAGIECDGARYHNEESARDRDIGRQQVLERLGWKILRVWSPDWFRDRKVVLSDLDQSLRDAMKGSENAVAKAEVSPAEVSEPPETVAFQAASGLPEGTVLYRAHSKAVSYPAMAMDDWAAHIVQAEGPLHEEELMAALRLDYGYGSLGTRIRLQFAASVSNAARRGLIVANGLWYWPQGMTRTDVPVRLNRGTGRRFDYCCDEELQRAILMAARSAGRLTRVQLVEATSRLLGFRQTDQVKERLTTLVSQATDAGLLRRLDGDVLEAI